MVLKLGLILVTILFSNLFAGDIEWGGQYRFEANYLIGSDFNGKGKKAFGVHHMSLYPRFIVADGMEIRARFDMFQSYEGSQIGGLWGEKSLTNQTLQQSQPKSNLDLTHLYFTYIQDYGAWILGRAPIGFGLGMSYDKGDGLWDHWTSSRDMVGYKIVMGNMSFFPAIAKLSEGGLSQDDDVTDILFELSYELPDDDIKLGFFFQQRTGEINADSVAPYFDDVDTATTDRASYTRYNFFLEKAFSEMTFSAEVGIVEGDSLGFKQNGEAVGVSAFGAAFEWDWSPKDSDFTWGVDLGYASGDDPSTKNKFEGFFFNRNYDVAFLMFNYNVGQVDALSGRFLGHYHNSGSLGYDNTKDHHINKVEGEADTAALSNVIYFSPNMGYQWNENWFSAIRVTSALINQKSILDSTAAFNITDVGSLFGTELDLNIVYRPWKRFEWMTEFGALLPGDAFKGGDLDLKTDLMYGLRSKISVQF